MPTAVFTARTSASATSSTPSGTPSCSGPFTRATRTRRPFEAVSSRPGAEDLARLVLAQEAEEVESEDAEEDDRLLGRHRHPRDLLVGDRREAPEPGARLVEAVDRARKER